MRRTLGIVTAAGLVGLSIAGFTTSTLLSDFSKSINEAKSLSTNITVQPVGGVASRYTIDLKKPNLAKIDGPTSLIVADGTNITTYDKNDKTYFKEPETDIALNGLFRSDEMAPWAGFFKANAYDPVASTDKGTVSKGVATYAEVDTTYGKSGNKQVKYFLDPSDKVARQVEIDLKSGDNTLTTLVLTKQFSLNSGGRPDLFTFTAPDGSKEISLEEVMASKWFFNLEEAKKAAAATHRKIFVDFMATWCGPCKMLQREVLDTEKFKKIAGKKLILARIDVDAQQDVASKYNVTAMPTQMVLDADGNKLDEIVGYGGPQMFYDFLNKNL